MRKKIGPIIIIVLKFIFSVETYILENYHVFGATAFRKKIKRHPFIYIGLLIILYVYLCIN